MRFILILFLLISANAFGDTETIAPDATIASTNITNDAITRIDEDPDSPDGVLGAATSNSVSTAMEVSFPTATGTLTVGADLQEFRMRVEQFDEGQTGVPSARIELWESGVLVRAGSNVDVPNGGVVISFTWNASEITNEANIEAELVGNKQGGGGGARNAVSFDAIEWNADYVGAAPVAGKKWLIN